MYIYYCIAISDSRIFIRRYRLISTLRFLSELYYKVLLTRLHFENIVFIYVIFSESANHSY